MIPTLQILLAAFNSSQYLSEQLESILAQDFQDFEILINDGSSADAVRPLARWPNAVLPVQHTAEACRGPSERTPDPRFRKKL